MAISAKRFSSLRADRTEEAHVLPHDSLRIDPTDFVARIERFNLDFQDANFAKVDEGHTEPVT